MIVDLQLLEAEILCFFGHVVFLASTFTFKNTSLHPTEMSRITSRLLGFH